MMIPNGRHDNISHKDYHADEAVSKSKLDRVDKSYHHYEIGFSDDTEAMLFGRAAHSAILTPDRFYSEVAVAPKVDKRTKQGKLDWAAFVAKAGDKDVITEQDYDTIVQMKEAVMAHPEARRLLSLPGKSEVSFFCEDKATGLRKKARPDRLTDSNIFIDLKTCQDASYWGFRQSVRKFRYDVQAAYYPDVAAETTGEKYGEFFFIAVEKKAPFGVGVYKLDTATIEQGREAYYNNLQKIYIHQRNPHLYRGYYEGCEVLSLVGEAEPKRDLKQEVADSFEGIIESNS